VRRREFITLLRGAAIALALATTAAIAVSVFLVRTNLLRQDDGRGSCAREFR
jgi:hypothetical protein